MKKHRHFILGLLAIALGCTQVQGEQRILYRSTSAYNNILVTEDDQGLRTLSFDAGRRRLRQSVAKVGDPEHLELPYLKGMLVGLAFAPKPERMLVIGLGGGTLPTFLHRYYPQTTIDVVEIDPEVVHVARTYFAFRPDAHLRVHVEDGRKFIEEGRRSYDIIFLDAYGPEAIPFRLATREFLLAVRRVVTPEGVVVANVHSAYSNPLYDSMVQTYQDVFDDLIIVEVPGAGNRIFLAKPSPQRVDGTELAQRAGKVATEKGFRFDMAPLVANGFRRPPSASPAARVLLDADAPREND